MIFRRGLVCARELEKVATVTRYYLSNTGWWRVEQMHMRYVVTATVKKYVSGLWDCVNGGTLRLRARPWRGLSMIPFSRDRSCVQVQSTMNLK